MKILLIAGHGQGDPGACAGSYQEATLTRELVSALSVALKPYADVTVFDTTKNMYKYLKSNSFDFTKYDYVLEIHFNACVNDTKGNGVTTGTEILVHSREEATSVEQLIVDKIAAAGFTNRGVRRRSNLQNMNICKGKQNVSYALLETCFIDDVDDMYLYILRKKDIIMAIVNGIVEGFGLGVTDKFTDISNCYGRQAINELFDMGIVNGVGDGKFAPNNPVTREDVAIMIRNAIRYIIGR